jgi:hypothetical protein
MMVINKDSEQSREVELQLEEFKPAGSAQVWLQDETHLGDPLPTVVVADTFTYTFPPYSVTLLILEPAQVNWLLWGIGAVVVLVAAGLGFGLSRRSR